MRMLVGKKCLLSKSRERQKVIEDPLKLVILDFHIPYPNPNQMVEPSGSRYSMLRYLSALAGAGGADQMRFRFPRLKSRHLSVSRFCRSFLTFSPSAVVVLLLPASYSHLCSH